MNRKSFSSTSPLTTEEILLDPLNQKLLQTLTAFSKSLAVYGYHVRVSSPAALSRLSELNSDKKNEIINFYQLWNSWINPEGHTFIDPTPAVEKSFIERALAHYGLTVDDEFWGTLEENQVVEIYGHDMIQLYRSLSFFQYSSYSLLDISVYEWYLLWARPRRVIDSMMAYGTDVLRQPRPLCDFNVPRHVLRETMVTEVSDVVKPRACLIDFKKIMTLKSGGSQQPGGLICTSRAEVIAEGHEALNIEFV